MIYHLYAIDLFRSGKKMKTRNSFLFLVLIIFVGLAVFTNCGNDNDAKTPLSDSGNPSDDDDDDNDDASDDDDDDDDNDDDNDDDDSVPSATVTVDDPPAGNPLARKIVVKTDAPCSLAGKVTTVDEPGYGPSVPETSSKGTHHEFWFYGLLEDLNFEYTFRLANKEGPIVAQGTFSTDPLPLELPDVAYLYFEENPAFKDWYLMYCYDNQNYLNLRLIYDRKGRIRFYHPSSAGDFIQVLDNGDFVSTLHSALIATRLDGTEYQLFPVNLNPPVIRDTHHKFYVNSADATWAMVVFARSGAGVECDLVTPTNSAVADGIAQIDSAGNEVWRFDYFDHTDELPPENMDPDFCQIYFWGPDTYDLTHGNSVTPYPGENAYLISYLSQDRIIKVSRDTGEIFWQMGHDLDFTWIGSEPADEKWFLLQHEPIWLPGDHILIYDNNKWQSWSRALELEVDLVNMTVEKVWEYRVPHGFGGGNAQRNENGNTLISSGNSRYTVEVIAGGGAGDELFILEYENAFSRAQYYRPLWVD